MSESSAGCVLALAATLLLAACAGGGEHRLVADAPVRIGRPYTVGGRVYAPSDDTRYDRVGLASWYGNREQGHATANGERFDRRRVSAAHATLPMPSYVAVTRLDTGRTMLVRINDRGPYARDRILDLSEAAARQLGLVQAGSALVRVRRVLPSAAERNALRRGYPVLLASVTPTATPPRVGRTAPPVTYAPYTPTPPSEPRTPPPYASYPPTPPPVAITPPPSDRPAPLPPPPDAEYLPETPPESYTSRQVAPPPAPMTRPPASPTAPATGNVRRGIVVTTAGDPDAADALAAALRGEGGHVVVTTTGYRVVTGPYANETARAAALARLRAQGYQAATALDAPAKSKSEVTGSPTP